MYDFNRMEQLPHRPKPQKFLTFFHGSEESARQGETGREFAGKASACSQMRESPERGGFAVVSEVVSEVSGTVNSGWGR